MKIVPVICFALATAVAGSMLPVSSSYANYVQTYPTQSQNCVSTGELPTDGVGNCKENKAASHPAEHGFTHSGLAARAGRSR
jgi:hypothetical protein